MRIVLFLCLFGLFSVKGHQSLPSDCKVDNCTDAISRIDKTNTESYCSGLVSSWICLERILGNCYDIFEGYGKPEVNEMINNITSSINTDCDYNKNNGCRLHAVFPVFALTLLVLIKIITLS